jgi:WSC domain.
VLMTNHLHLLVMPDAEDSLSKLFQSVGRRYVQYFNHSYKRSGTLWVQLKKEGGRMRSSRIIEVSLFVGVLFLLGVIGENGVAHAQQYLGCWWDDPSRVLENDQGYADDMTNSKCIATCREKGFSFAGTQYYEQCYCGNSYDRNGKLEESRCNTPCRGNSAEMCGGRWANSVYSTGVTTQPQPSPGGSTTGDLRMEDNADLTGPYIRYFGLPEARPELCRDACAQDSNCAAFTYVKPGAYPSNPNNAVCYLKSSAGEWVPSTCCVSGARGVTTCGTIAGIECSEGYYCDYLGREEEMTDASGICKKSGGANLSSGTYQVAADNAGTIHNSTWTLQVSGNQITGTSQWDCCPGPRVDALTGRIEGNRVIIERDCSGQGWEGECRQVYDGTIGGGTIEGSWSGTGARPSLM